MTTPLAANQPPTDAKGAWAWASWRGVLLFSFGIALLRAAYLLFLSPYELVADEAHYWDWSRRPALSYYSKGPGVAWLIGASTGFLGTSEAAVRLPAVICGLLAMLAAARLGAASGQPGIRPAIPPPDERVAFFAAAAMCCVPAYHAVAMLMTIDGPYIACWILSAWAAMALFRSWAHGGNVLAPCAALGLALGVGFLFKFTILLLLPGLVIFWLRHRRAMPLHPRLAGALMLALAVFACCMAPVIIWNVRHDWPTLAHLLGHLGVAGGDVAPRIGAGKPWSWKPEWTIEFLAGQIGLIGPALLLIAAALAHALRSRREGGPPSTGHGLSSPAIDSFLFWCAAPVLLFYFALTWFTDVEGNWPIAGYTTLLVLAARRAPSELTRYRAMVHAWLSETLRPRPRRGLLRRKPETTFQIAWHWSIGYGAVAAFGMLILPWLAGLPLVGKLVPMQRLTGQRAAAASVHRAVSDVMTRTQDPSISGNEPLYVASSYGRAGLLAFYLPGHPPVCSAASLMGGRRSSYDFFEDTDLRRAELRGRVAALIGAPRARWERVLGSLDVFADDPELELLVVRWPGLAAQAASDGEAPAP